MNQHADPSGYCHRSVNSGFTALLSLMQIDLNEGYLERDCPVDSSITEMVLRCIRNTQLHDYSTINKGPDPIVVHGWRLFALIRQPRLAFTTVDIRTRDDADSRASAKCIEKWVISLSKLEFQRRARRIQVADPCFGLGEAEYFEKEAMIQGRKDYSEPFLATLVTLMTKLDNWVKDPRFSNNVSGDLVDSGVLRVPGHPALRSWHELALSMMVAVNCCIQESTLLVEKMTLLSKENKEGDRFLNSQTGVHESIVRIMFAVLGEGRSPSRQQAEMERPLPKEIEYVAECKTLNRDGELIALVGCSALSHLAQTPVFVNAPASNETVQGGQLFIWFEGLRAVTQVLRIGISKRLPWLKLEACRAIALMTADSAVRGVESLIRAQRKNTGCSAGSRCIEEWDFIHTVDRLTQTMLLEPGWWRPDHPWQRASENDEIELPLTALRALSRLLRLDVCADHFVTGNPAGSSHHSKSGLEIILKIVSEAKSGPASIFCLRVMCNSLLIASSAAAKRVRDKWNEPVESDKHGRCRIWQHVMLAVLEKMIDSDFDSDHGQEASLVHECCRLLATICQVHKEAGSFLVNNNGFAIAAQVMRSYAEKGHVMGAVISMFAASGQLERLK